jgi:hypothetical protein
MTTLAAWQLTALVFYDRGPFRILYHVRAVLVRIGLERLKACFYCMAAWTSLGMIVAAYPLSWQTPLLALAVGGAVSLIELRLGRAGTLRPAATQRPAAEPTPAAADGSAPAAAPRTMTREPMMANGSSRS